MARHEEAVHYAYDEPHEGGGVHANEEKQLGRVRAAALRHTLHHPKLFIKNPFSTQGVN